MMNLVAIPNSVGGHLGGWRHPDAYDDTVMNLDCVIELARIAERGKLDAVFLADGNAVRDMDRPALFAANFPSARPAGFEPTTVLSAVAMMTRHVGVVATATTTYDEPYSVARRFASLDHVSKGRGGWNLVTGSYEGDALNFGRSEHLAREERYGRAQEFYEVVVDLWDSWADDAFPQNKATGQFLDPSRVREINHKGKHFIVKGPLNVARSVQGRPVVFMAGQSEPGMELAARYADALFGAGSTKQDCQTAYADIKGRMGKYGRPTEALRILPGISVFVGRTSEEADELYQQLQSLISPALGVHYLSKMVTRDLTGYPVDGMLPELPREVVGGSSLRHYIIEMARRENLTIRQTYERVLPSIGGPLFKGNPSQIADEMEDWYTSQACDGFTIMAPVAPRGLRDFVDLVVPELQRRGLFRRDYTSDTLRGHLGLAVPANTHFAPSAASAGCG
ncbi:MAG TPA: LLM class flavin-dependent oxidoreductase [Stellaceae bacterium]|nr:LLM class flavin-dependent oxidoreductase [Stellaceae bacterium]